MTRSTSSSPPAWSARRSSAGTLVILLSEYAIRRKIGGPEVMRAQLQRLLDAMKEPNITIQILPEDAQIYLNGSFTLLSCDGRKDVAYAETPIGGGDLIDQPRLVNALKVRFDLIRSAALPATESEKLIRTIMESV
ncbi:DUF5753 domain-containing protein [Actinoallomurus sp. NPDC052274]|uniref:DUF5753 domain-containing protein n=1 Tax=Actinoallomurus sp. NPDC052274 TaxID=3155420 RepID=UPI00342D71BE